jgi:hypothetical protein
LTRLSVSGLPLTRLPVSGLPLTRLPVSGLPLTRLPVSVVVMQMPVLPLSLVNFSERPSAALQLLRPQMLIYSHRLLAKETVVHRWVRVPLAVDHCSQIWLRKQKMKRQKSGCWPQFRSWMHQPVLK